MISKSRNLSLSLNSFNKFNKIRAIMLDPLLKRQTKKQTLIDLVCKKFVALFYRLDHVRIIVNQYDRQSPGDIYNVEEIKLVISSCVNLFFIFTPLNL